MNERIRHLIEQHERINNLYIIGPVQKAEVEDFIEAIVRECIVTIQMGITRDGRNTDKYQRSVQHLNKIREHFGIE